MQPKIVAIRVTNQQEFDTVIEHMIECGYSDNTKHKPMSEWQFTMYGNKGPVWIEFKECPNVFFASYGNKIYDEHDVVSFDTFCTIAGIKLRAPKEVILNWPGLAANVTVTIKKDYIDFNFTKSITGFRLNSFQQSEIVAALNSLRHE